MSELAARISAAKAILQEAERSRDRYYPGTPTWLRENEKVQEWEQRVRDLEAEASLLPGT